MEKGFGEELWGIKAKENMDIVGRDIARARSNYWKNRRLEEEQERRQRAMESQYDYSWKEYTSTGEEWENDCW